MLVLTRPQSVSRPAPHQGPLPVWLQTVAIGLGTVQLLLDIGQVDEAKETLRSVREEVQALCRA